MASVITKRRMTRNTLQNTLQTYVTRVNVEIKFLFVKSHLHNIGAARNQNFIIYQLRTRCSLSNEYNDTESYEPNRYVNMFFIFSYACKFWCNTMTLKMVCVKLFQNEYFNTVINTLWNELL